VWNLASRPEKRSYTEGDREQGAEKTICPPEDIPDRKKQVDCRKLHEDLHSLFFVIIVVVAVVGSSFSSVTTSTR
jgi:hypothetical protein